MMVAQASRQFRGRPPGWPALLLLPLSPTLRAGRYGLVACKKYVCMYVYMYVCTYAGVNTWGMQGEAGKKQETETGWRMGDPSLHPWPTAIYWLVLQPAIQFIHSPILDSGLGCSKKLVRRKSGRTEPLLRCMSSPSSLPQGLLLSLPTSLPA